VQRGAANVPGEVRTAPPAVAAVARNLRREILTENLGGRYARTRHVIHTFARRDNYRARSNEAGAQSFLIC
jgi:hypothetical protein